MIGVSRLPPPGHILTRAGYFDMHIAIYHNILWSKYKGGVFSQVYVQSMARGIGTSFIQIAETTTNGSPLGMSIFHIIRIRSGSCFAVLTATRRVGGG